MDLLELSPGFLFSNLGSSREEGVVMTREAEFLSGSLLERHWGADDGGVATVLVTRKAAKKKKKSSKKPATTRGCQTGKKTCRGCQTGKKTCRCP